MRAASPLLQRLPVPRQTALRALLRFLALAALLATVAGCSPAMRGSQALAAGDYPAALERYHEALRQEPNSLYLRQRIGLTYFAMGDYARAEASFDTLLLLAPEEPETFFYLCLSRIGKGEVAKGLADLSRLRWPFRFRQQQYVRDEAARLQNHQDAPPEQLIQALRNALEQGRQEQEREDRDRLGAVS